MLRQRWGKIVTTQIEPRIPDERGRQLQQQPRLQQAEQLQGVDGERPEFVSKSFESRML